VKNVRSALLLGALPALVISLTAANAGAYCRTTTCDINDPTVDCHVDADGCAVTGAYLYWKEGCLSFSVQKDGSPKRGITYDTFDKAIQLAFTQWVNAPCVGGTPSFKLWDFDATFGPSTCGEPEYNRKAANANIWMFRDDDWPYPGVSATLALTTVSFEIATGRILDADVEVNSFAIDITTSTTNPRADLQSIATHEAGHFLGLAHSDDPTATMYAAYQPGNLGFRTLRQDDQEAICKAYPVNRTFPACSSPVPVRGFSQLCGGENPVIPDPGKSEDEGSRCSVQSLSGAASGSNRGVAAGALVTSALAAAVGLRRRRRRSA
jgi:hypothetical protein